MALDSPDLESSPPHGSASPRLKRFATNAIWSILSVLVSLAAGLLLSPYFIRKLGADGYGIWSLVFSIIGYYVVLDFGFRSSVVNLTAHAAAASDFQKINRVVSTALAYTSLISLMMLAVVFAIAPSSPRWLGVSDTYADVFPLIFVLVSGGTVLSFSTNIVSGCLEGFQQYARLRRLQTVALGSRTLGYFLVLWFGGGLLELVYCTCGYWIAQWIGYIVLLRRVFPQLKLGWGLVQFSVLREMFGYGMYTSINTVAMIGQQQTPPVFISRGLPDAAVGYFALPNRIVQVPIGMIRTVADMLNPLAADYSARQQHEALGRIGRLGNRYGFILYAPIALLMLTWGTDVIRLWIGADYAANVGPILPYFLLSTWIALAGQGASIGILFGIRAHRWCAWGLMGEAIVVTTASALLLDQGLVVLAQWVAAAMVANRGLLSAWVVCRQLNLSLRSFLWFIYGVPSLLAVPVYLALQQLSAALPVKNWWLVLFATAISGFGYLVPAFFICVDPAHRQTGIWWCRRMLARRTA